MPWVPSNIEQRLPRSAIAGGRTTSGQKIYIARAWVEGELVPSIVIPGSKKAYAVTLSGNVEELQSYEVLCGDVYSWKKGRLGDVSGSSLIAGRSKNGEELYVGRVPDSGGLYVGTIQPSRKMIRCVAEHELVVEREDYEVLTMRTCEKGCGSCIIL